MARSEKAIVVVFLSVFFTVTLIGGLCQNAFSQEKGKPIKLTYALFQPGTAALSKKNTEFAKEIEKRTNGRATIHPD